MHKKLVDFLDRSDPACWPNDCQITKQDISEPKALQLSERLVLPAGAKKSDANCGHRGK